jgi:hypothetical protein
MSTTPKFIFRFRLFRQEHGYVRDTANVLIEVNDLSVDTSDAAMLRVCNAVAKWIENSTEGKEAWDESGEDFNIADLVDHTEEPNLCVELLKQGITKLDISIEDEVQDGPEDFTFDSILPMRAPDGFNNPLD